MRVPPLTFRLEKGTALTSAEIDKNFRLLKDFANGLAALFETVFNADGTLKTGAVTSDSLADRSVIQRKLDWLANFYETAAGTDTYSATINPTADFTLGDGADTAFLCILKFTNANTGACSLDVNAIGPKPIKKFGDQALVAGEIAAGSVHVLVYDGTNFQLMTALNPAPGHGLAVYTAGSGNFTVPAGVFAVETELVGGGGGGGGNVSATGGGGGGYTFKRLAVTPGQVIPYVVGAGGTASTGGNAGDGGATSFNTTIIAAGGKGGDTGGQGGAGSGGDLTINGRQGAFATDGISAADKRSGGDSGRGMGFGGWVNASAQAPTGYGGGGYGDTDAGGGWSSSDGGGGLIIVRW